MADLTPYENKVSRKQGKGFLEHKLPWLDNKGNESKWKE